MKASFVRLEMGISERWVSMQRKPVRNFPSIVVFLCVFFLPALAWAQASIVGLVRDESGGVLPGVTVEAASPALIEGVRAATTDEQGRYRFEALRPGPRVLREGEEARRAPVWLWRAFYLEAVTVVVPRLPTKSCTPLGSAVIVSS